MPSKPTCSLRAALLVAGAAVSLAAQSPIGTLIAEQSRTAFTVQGAGARAMGLGGAFIAVADDATAVSFNPAGLAQLLKPEVSFVGRGLHREVAFEDVQTRAGAKQLLVSDSLISNTRFDPLFLSGTVPLRLGGRTLALQLSLQRVIALGESDSRDLTEYAQGQTSAGSHLFQNISQRGQIDLYSFAVAYECSQRLLLGLSTNVWRGAWDLASYSSKETDGATSHVAFTQSNRLEGTNFNLGLIWRWPTWSLGLVHHTAFHADYTFSSTQEALPSKTGPVVRPAFATGLHWPSTTGLGFAWRPGERWLVTSDVVHTPWSKARYMTSRASLDGLSFFDLDKGPRTPDATDFRAGMEYLFLSAAGSIVPLRLGLSWEPQPVVDRLTLEQRVVRGASAGTGFKRGAYALDLAYRYGWGVRQASQFLDVDQILSPAASRPNSIGTERFREQRLDFSFIVQFEREPVERLLHYLFVGA